jgi:hypothetical protein
MCNILRILVLLENRDFLDFRMIFKVPLNQIFSNFNTMLYTIKYRLSLIIQDYSGQYKNRQIINNKLLLIVLFGKLYGHGLEIMGCRQTSMAARNIYT